MGKGLRVKIKMRLLQIRVGPNPMTTLLKKREGHRETGKKAARWE